MVQLHGTSDSIEEALGSDRFPVDGLPYEYGGRAGMMKDLNGTYIIINDISNNISYHHACILRGARQRCTNVKVQPCACDVVFS